MSLINNVSAILSYKTDLDDVVYSQNKVNSEDEISILDKLFYKLIYSKL